MMCGIPTSGKSTYIKNNLSQFGFDAEGYICLSTDNYVESLAKEQGISYNESLRLNYKEAKENLPKLLDFAIRYGLNIIWDQTNLTKKIRKNKIFKIPDYYEKVIVFCEISLEEAMIRNQQRPGKLIDPNVIKDMYRILEPPDKDENFDDIIRVNYEIHSTESPDQANQAGKSSPN